MRKKRPDYFNAIVPTKGGFALGIYCDKDWVQEIVISTDKFHARGPVGLEGLTSMKWVVLGDGQVRG